MILDGAMGTMIQAYNFQEEDYRGERFKDYELDILWSLSLQSWQIHGAVSEV